MPDIHAFQDQYHQIEADWSRAALPEKQNLLEQLEGLEARLAIVQSVPATKLFRSVRQLREHILATVLPSQRMQGVRDQLADLKMPGEGL